MSGVSISNLIEADFYQDQLRQDARNGLTASPKMLPPKYFYDDRGSDLFDRITELAEYYPTRTEAGLLRRFSSRIASVTRAESLWELGSGSSEKTPPLLDALLREGTLSTYVPIDVSHGALRGAVTTLKRAYPEVSIQGYAADIERHLPEIAQNGTRVVVFLGSTIGNYPPQARRHLLASLAHTLRAGEHLLLGVDLIKDRDRLFAAYDDSCGVTAEFNRNVLRVLNRELGGTFDVDAFEHVVRWNAEHERIEMRLRAREAMTVQLAAIDLDIGFSVGEEMLTEYSHKFRRPRIEQELVGSGFELRDWFTDEAQDFALVLARRA